MNIQNETNKEIISRIKSKIKLTNADNRIVTNKMVYSLLCKWRNILVQRQDSRNRILSVSYIYQPLTEELIEVDKITAKCTQIKSGCIIKRTKRVLPKMINGYDRPIIREVTAIDGESNITLTTRKTYIQKTLSPNFKYNKERYYWYEDNYLWFPDLEWETVMITAYFEDDISNYACESCGEQVADVCKSRLDEPFFFPTNMVAELETPVDKELRDMLGIRKDESINKNSNQ